MGEPKMALIYIHPFDDKSNEENHAYSLSQRWWFLTESSSWHWIPWGLVVLLQYFCADDPRNRCTQYLLGLKRKFGIKEWSMRFNTTLLDNFTVDSWLLYKGGKCFLFHMSQIELYSIFSETLVDKTQETVGSFRGSVRPLAEPQIPLSGIGIHLTSTSRNRCRKYFIISKAIYRERC